MHGMSRRSFLASTALGAGSLIVLVACGGDDSSGSSEPQGGGSGDASASTADPTTLVLVTRWPPESLTPGPLRLPVSIATVSGEFQDGSETLTAKLVDAQTGDLVADGLTATRHRVSPDLPAYWPFQVEVDRVGVFALQVEGFSDPGLTQTLEPEAVPAPKPGEALPPVESPTVADGRGVDPICTRFDGQCPFHDVTVTEALAMGKPIAYLIGTPAHCQTGTCSPVLETMMSVAEQTGDAVTWIHSEVYTDDSATVIAPAVEAYGMTFEPSLFITGADGVVVERLDSLFDEEELKAALAEAGVQL